jgi:hypothetical protein
MKTRPWLKVKISHGHFSFMSGPDSEDILSIRIINRGLQRVVFDSFGFIQTDRTKIMIEKPFLMDFPCEISPLRAIYTYIPFSYVRERMNQIKIHSIFLGYQGEEIFCVEPPEYYMERIINSPFDRHPQSQPENPPGSFDLYSRIK